MTDARVAVTGAKVTDVCGLFSDGTVTLFSACASALSAAAFISFFSPVKVGLGYNSHNRARIFNNRSYFFPFFRRAKLKKLTMKHFIDLMILLPSRNLCFSHILENRIIIKTFLAVLLHTFLYYFHFPTLHFHSTEFLIADFL